jgi:hypothetical protein
MSEFNRGSRKVGDRIKDFITNTKIYDQIVDPIYNAAVETNLTDYVAFGYCKRDDKMSDEDCRNLYIFGKENPASKFSGSLTDGKGEELYSWKDSKLYEKGVVIGDYVADNKAECLIMLVEFIPFFGAPAAIALNVQLEEYYDESTSRAEFIGVVVKNSLAHSLSVIPFIGPPLSLAAEFAFDIIWEKVGGRLSNFLDRSEGDNVPLPGFFYKACSFFQCRDDQIAAADELNKEKFPNFYNRYYDDGVWVIGPNPKYDPNKFCKNGDVLSYYNHSVYYQPDIPDSRYEKGGLVTACCPVGEKFDGVSKCVPNSVVFPKRNHDQRLDFQCRAETDGTEEAIEQCKKNKKEIYVLWQKTFYDKKVNPPVIEPIEIDGINLAGDKDTSNDDLKDNIFDTYINSPGNPGSDKEKDEELIDNIFDSYINK